VLPKDTLYYVFNVRSLALDITPQDLFYILAHFFASVDELPCLLSFQAASGSFPAVSSPYSPPFGSGFTVDCLYFYNNTAMLRFC